MGTTANIVFGTMNNEVFKPIKWFEEIECNSKRESGIIIDYIRKYGKEIITYHHNPKCPHCGKIIDYGIENENKDYYINLSEYIKLNSLITTNFEQFTIYEINEFTNEAEINENETFNNIWEQYSDNDDRWFKTEVTLYLIKWLYMVNYIKDKYTSEEILQDLHGKEILEYIDNVSNYNNIWMRLDIY